MHKTKKKNSYVVAVKLYFNKRVCNIWFVDLLAYLNLIGMNCLTVKKITPPKSYEMDNLYLYKFDKENQLLPFCFLLIRIYWNHNYF